MEPALQPNDLVVAFDRSSYAVGDVVVYRVPAAEPGEGVNIVHRIVGGSARTGFLVKGDSREGADHWRPRGEEILGRVRFQGPRAGYALLFLRTSLGLALLCGLTTLLVALGAITGPSRKTGDAS